MPVIQPAVHATPVRSLDQVPAGSGGKIVGLNGGRLLVSRLATLGFVPGGHVSMVQNYGKGAVIVLIRRSRCALGRGEAAQIVVEEAKAP
jgi:ferrous iron transport protein A